MIHYSKRDHSYRITITLAGSFTVENILTIMKNTNDYVGDSDTPVAYLVDCRELNPLFTDEMKMEIVNSVNERLTHSYTRFAIVYTKEMMSLINPFLLNRLNVRRDTKVLFFDSIERATSWLDEETFPPKIENRPDSVSSEVVINRVSTPDTSIEQLKREHLIEEESLETSRKFVDNAIKELENGSNYDALFVSESEYTHPDIETDSVIITDPYEEYFQAVS